jgi:hypothetical protein
MASVIFLRGCAGRVAGHCGEACKNFEAAEREAAAVWARSIGGSALVGLLPELAANMSLMEWLKFVAGALNALQVVARGEQRLVLTASVQVPYP